MRRALAATALTLGLGTVLVAPHPASACDPDTFPNCQTYCGAIASRYRWVQGNSDLPLPGWPQTGVAGCP